MGFSKSILVPIISTIEEIISEPSPQVFHPPSMTINLLVFSIEFTNDSYLIGFITLKSKSSIDKFLFLIMKAFIASFAIFVE